MASHSYQNQRPPLRAKAVPMPRPHERVLEIARVWLAPLLIASWLCRFAWHFAS